MHLPQKYKNAGYFNFWYYFVFNIYTRIFKNQVPDIQ